MKARKTDETTKNKNAQSRVSAKKSPVSKLRSRSYQRTHQDAPQRWPRAAADARRTNLKASRPSNDLVNVEGEEEPEAQNAGGGQSRLRETSRATASRTRIPPFAAESPVSAR